MEGQVTKGISCPAVSLRTQLFYFRCVGDTQSGNLFLRTLTRAKAFFILMKPAVGNLQKE